MVSQDMTRQGPLRSQENVSDDNEINLVTSRKGLSAARKKNAIEATARCVSLFGFIKAKKWDDLVHKLDYYESDAREWIEEKNDDGSTRWKSLIIHLVCERKPPAEVVAELIRIYPESVGIKNYGGDLPIHIACRENADKDVIEIILDSDEYECAKITDCEGRLPLHLAASNKNVSVKTIQNLITVNERATRSPDDFQLLPLHWACSKNASPRVVETIIQAYPYAVEAKDAWGRTPVDLAKMNKQNPDKAKIIELLSRDVASWNTAMMSTVVTLSNKVLEAEKLEAEFKEHVKEIEFYKDTVDKKDRHIDTLKLELKMLEERFVDEIQYLKKKHADEQRIQKEKSDEIIAQLTKDKNDAEKKLNDLKKLVDEVVSQLKQHQSIVDEKESERKKLKQRAVSLLQKIEEHKGDALRTREENKKLKQECSNLQDEIERRDEHLMQLKSSFQQPIRMLQEAHSEDNSTIEDSYYHGREMRNHGFRRTEIDVDRERVVSTNFRCQKLDDGSSASFL